MVWNFFSESHWLLFLGYLIDRLGPTWTPTSKWSRLVQGHSRLTQRPGQTGTTDDHTPTTTAGSQPHSKTPPCLYFPACPTLPPTPTWIKPSKLKWKTTQKTSVLRGGTPTRHFLRKQTLWGKNRIYPSATSARCARIVPGTNQIWTDTCANTQ